ncbi:hypothetical protein B0A55_01188 [Friedmanniomyces simplex]|uniref:Uncharacterized protein n=1 Tax=Friedmanniomyces simplex TaxID=329884 RepID=A0A4U0Y1L1_9PEZI|nr:hypothetical protein B0A55_01188 [Friedmanniomyces simplex]
MAISQTIETADTLDVPTKGIKRSKIELEATTIITSHSVHLTLSPCATPESSTLAYFEDDCHDDYEFIRIPKKRDYDIFRVPRRQPSDRDKAELPLTVTQPDGTRVTMWAKLDTGADVNTINLSTLETLLGHEMAHQRMRSMTEEQFSMIGDTHFDAAHSVDLDFVAGVSKKSFSKVNFIIIPDNAAKSNRDGVPNVLLGFPFLQQESMLMIDVEYCHDAEVGLPVISEKAENECEGAAGILPIVKLKPVRGITRPGR